MDRDCTENFNVNFKIDSDNGHGVSQQTNKTNRAWQSAQVYRSLLFMFSFEEFYQLRETPQNFVNYQHNFLWEFPCKAWIFLGVLRKVGNRRGVYCICYENNIKYVYVVPIKFNYKQKTLFP